MILLAVALFGAFLTNSTTFGRYLYAIGGNADAARLSGINNKRNILKVYALLGGTTGIASLIFTARVGSAAPDAGVLKELDAIAACVIGGASLMGGRGTIFGACLGALDHGEPRQRNVAAQRPRFYAGHYQRLDPRRGGRPRHGWQKAELRTKTSTKINWLDWVLQNSRDCGTKSRVPLQSVKCVIKLLAGSFISAKFPDYISNTSLFSLAKRRFDEERR